MRTIAIDTETFRISPAAVAPKVVCASFAELDENGQPETLLLGNGDPELPHMLEACFKDPEVRVVWLYGAYDLACICATWPHLIPVVFESVAEGRHTDVSLREKLLALSSTGRLEDYEAPDGSTHRLSFDMATLGKKWLGKDRTEEKEDENGWRLNYDQLDGMRAEEYPPDAAEYASQDALDTLLIYYAQERDQEGRVDYGVIRTDAARTAFSFALQLATCWGVATDQEQVEKIAAIVQSELVPENLNLLVEQGILRPATPPREHARGAKDHVPGCPKKNCGCPPKMTAGTKPSICKENLKARVVQVCTERKLPIRLTDKGRMATRRRNLPLEQYRHTEHFEFVSTDSETFDVVADLDPVLSQYQRRQMLVKIVDNQLPLLREHAVVHGPYDFLKETGRTSSYGSDHKKPLGEKGNLYPAVQIQQVPRMLHTQKRQVGTGQDGKPIFEGGEPIDVRACYRPRPGRTFIDVDFTSLELVCVAQTTWDLFKMSKHRELINAGIDCHAYLGAQIAFLFGADEYARAFQEAVRAESTDPMVVCKTFMALKKAEGDHAEGWRAFYKHFRNMAKPVGLGFPGGLGPEKLSTAIAPQYGVVISVEEAKTLREIWHQTYPEMRPYFEWVNEQRDSYNETIGFDEFTEREIPGYCYRTPLGMIRRGASYCAAANGKAMQSPGAEGALIGFFELTRACYDWTRESILFGVRPWAFVHDQALADTTEDRTTWHEQATEFSRLFCQGARKVFPDVNIQAEPMLTDVWSKKAEATFDESGRLIPWRPN